ncbi:MAG TPA: Lrp/AsnC ligand binding domain-containing protein [Candidatus Nitrosocosmicus sp.]|nr:Lrp/AsnC ligand binding domain-containing protein [Candidatus Nitrosocosmicus sp.]
MVSTAIVLLNCEVGSAKGIANEFQKVSEINEVREVMGFYDIIMRISANSVDELKEIITKQLKKTDKIFSTTTLVLTSSGENTLFQ